MSFDNNRGSCKIISVTPTRLLKTKVFEKKASLPAEQKLRSILFHSIELDKPQVTRCKGQKSILPNVVEVVP